MSTAVRRALYGKLAGDGQLTALLGAAPAGLTHAIYHAVAPEGAAFPYVILNQQSEIPTYTFQQAEPLYRDELWLVKGVDHNLNSDVADAIRKRLDELLIDGTISISSAVQLYLRLDSGMAYTETDGGEIYRHNGGVYRLMYCAT